MKKLESAAADVYPQLMPPPNKAELQETLSIYVNAQKNKLTEEWKNGWKDEKYILLNKPVIWRYIKNKTCHRDRIARLIVPCPSQKKP